MAKVLGEKARYVARQAIKKAQNQLIVLILSFYVFAAGISYFLGVKNLLATLLFLIIAVPILILLSNRITGKMEQEKLSFRKGASGEEVIGYLLEGFPDEYRVIHDLKVPFGNIDHVVIGPSGFFLIETKNWRGVVTPDGKGEILLNGKPSPRKVVKNLTRTIMGIKDKVKVLSSQAPYIQGVLAFPSAYLDAKWGSTGYIHCVTDEKLYDYIVENMKSNTLSKKQIDEISHAFLALARMDKDFTPKTQ